MTLLLGMILPWTVLAAEHQSPALKLYSGYVTRVRCEGRLLVSAIGEQGLVALEALPPQVGCGVLLKPLGKTGRTNLALETTTGSANVILEITSPGVLVSRGELELKVRADE